MKIPKNLDELAKGLTTIVLPLFGGMALGYFVSEKKKDTKVSGDLVVDTTGELPEYYLAIKDGQLDTISSSKRVILKVKKVRK